VKQQAQFAEWTAKQVCCYIAFRNRRLKCHRVSHARSDDEWQPVARCAVAAAPQAAPAAANEWGITLEDSSIDDPSAASGGAALPEGLFYAFERASQPSASSESSGRAVAGAAESVDDLMAQLQGL
jgi:hypothetical protein